MEAVAQESQIKIPDQPTVLRQSPLGAGGWATASFVISYFISFLLFLPIARLLTPEDYGSFTIASVIASGIILVIENSLIRALVRTPGELNHLAQATFWLSVAASIAGTLVCSVGAIGLVILKKPELAIVLGSLSIAVLVACLGSVPLALLSRELDYRRKVLPETIPVGLAAGVALIAALLGAGVYSLVIYTVLRFLLTTIVAWLVVKWRPTLEQPNWLTIRQLLGFGLPAIGGEVALYARFNVDYLIGGALLGAAPIGIYTIAWNTADRAALLINSFFGQVGYATFAHLQNLSEKRERLRTIYISATRLIASVSLPLFVSLVFIREEIIVVLLGDKWLGAIEPMLPLLILQAFWVIFYPSVSLLLALGYSRTYAGFNLVSLGLTIGCLFLGARSGILGIAWAMFISVSLISLLWGISAGVLVKLKIQELWQIVWLPVLLTVVTTLITYFTHDWLVNNQFDMLSRLVGSIFAWLIVFGLVGRILWPLLRQDLRHLGEKLPTT